MKIQFRAFLGRSFAVVLLVLFLFGCAPTFRITRNPVEVRNCDYLGEIDWQGNESSLRNKGVEMGANIILITEEANQIVFVNDVKSFRRVPGETGLYVLRGKAYVCK